MKYFDRENPVKNLPDCYAKNTDSNNYKLLINEKADVDLLNIDISDIDESLDLDSATGSTLDLYGGMIEQARGTANDVKYRLMIKSKIMRNFTDADYNSLIKSIAMTFDCDVSKIKIAESSQPARIEMVSIPLDIVTKSDITQAEIVDIVSALMPVGIALNTFLFAGTFEFAESENVYDENTGFADEEQTIGGYFGNIAK